MSRKMFLDIVALYQFDNSIFDNAIFPSGLDRDTVINSILMNCRELDCSPNDPEFLKFAIGLWSKRNEYYFNETYKTLLYNYNPINNYDRHEVIKDINVKNETSKEQITDKGKAVRTPELVNTEKVAAFNESTPQVRTENDVTGSDTSDTSSTRDRDNTVGTNENNTRTADISGNIGVTSSQELIEQQREIVNISMYDLIATSFKSEFCILVY